MIYVTNQRCLEDLKLLNKTTTGIIFIDFETSYMKLADFGLKNDGYHPHQNILEDWSIYCAAWKYLDNPRIYSSCVDINDIKNDRQVCIDFREALKNVKLVIGHNLDKFDMKKFNARLIYHNLPPIDHKILTLDTLKACKKHFGFTSNRLDYVAKFLNIGKKMNHEGNPWFELLTKPTRQTLNHMVDYCKYDVSPLLEGVYLKIRPYIDHPDLRNDKLEDMYGCTHCGSKNTSKQGMRRTKAGKETQRYQCQDCGGWGSEKLEKNEES